MFVKLANRPGAVLVVVVQRTLEGRVERPLLLVTHDVAVLAILFARPAHVPRSSGVIQRRTIVVGSEGVAVEIQSDVFMAGIALWKGIVRVCDHTDEGLSNIDILPALVDAFVWDDPSASEDRPCLGEVRGDSQVGNALRHIDCGIPQSPVARDVREASWTHGGCASVAIRVSDPDHNRGALD